MHANARLCVRCRQATRRICWCMLHSAPTSYARCLTPFKECPAWLCADSYYTAAPWIMNATETPVQVGLGAERQIERKRMPW